MKNTEIKKNIEMERPNAEKLFLVRNLHKSKKYEEAFSENESILESHNLSQETWYRRGLLIQQLLLQESEIELTLEDALNSLEISSELSLTSGHPFVETGYYHYTYSGNSNTAIDYFTKSEEYALSLLKESLVGKTKCLLDCENFESALSVLESALSIFPEDLDFKILSDELEELKN